MLRKSLFLTAVFAIGVALAIGQATSAQTQRAGSTQVQVTPEQQAQLDRLKALEQELEKDRQALHNAITQYGWDSDQVDAAQDQLSKNRLEYRKLRRSLRQAGVAVPPPSGWGRGSYGPGGGEKSGMRGGRRMPRGKCPPCPCAQPQS